MKFESNLVQQFKEWNKGNNKLLSYPLNSPLRLSNKQTWLMQWMYVKAFYMWIQEIVQEEVPLVLEQDTWIDLAKYIYVMRQNYIQVKISQPRLN